MRVILRKILTKISELTGFTVIRVFNYQELSFQNFFNSISNIEGSIVECGVGYGDTFLILTKLAYKEKKDRNIWGFDSFEGFPDPSIYDKSPRNPKKGDWSDTSIRKVLEKLLKKGKLNQDYIKNNIKLIKGFFNQSLRKYDGGPIALLHLDCDLYNSYKECLQVLWPQLANGGIVLFDEYKSPNAFKNFPGAQRAIEEYLGPLAKNIKLNSYANKFYIFK